jgi:PAS domain S-box-containing protein
MDKRTLIYLDAQGYEISHTDILDTPISGDSLSPKTVFAETLHFEDRHVFEQALELARLQKHAKVIVRELHCNITWELSIFWLAHHQEFALSKLEAPQAIYSSEELLQTSSLRILPGISWSADVRGNITHIGENWTSSRGRLARTALGLGWLDSIIPEDRDRVYRRWMHSVTTGEPYETSFRCRTGDDTYRLQHAHSEAVRDSNGKIIAWAGVTFDIDEQRKNIEQHEIFRSLAENSSDYIIITDPVGKVLYLNDVCREALGFARHEDINATHFIDLFAIVDQTDTVNTILPSSGNDERRSASLRFINRSTQMPTPVSCKSFPLRNSLGEFIGSAVVGSDIRERQRYEQGLQVLAASAPAFIDNLDRSHTLRSIAKSVTEHFATFCVIDIINDDDEFERIAFAHRDIMRDEALDFRAPQLPNLPREHFIKRTMLDGESSVSIVDDEWIAKASISEERAAHLRSLDFDSIICVPIRGQDGKILGAFSFGLSKRDFGRYYDSQDIIFAEELARRAGLALSNASIFERERRIALTFQEQALPTTLPDFLGLHLSAEYRPGKSEARVGGDWYDAFPLHDGRLTIIVGDVVGNGLHAAAVMNRLRQAMQTAALINPDPNFILDAGDRMLQLHDPDMYATAIAAIYDPITRIVTFALAGHPGPVVVDWNRSVRQHSVPGLLLGLRTELKEYATGSIVLQPGDMLVFYTDGITEMNRDPMQGQKNLEKILAKIEIVAAENAAKALVEAVLASQPAEDDIAVFVLRVDGLLTSGGCSLYYHDIHLAQHARRLFMQLLEAQSIAFADPLAAEIVFGELLSNVARHAPGPVRIELHCTDREAILSIADSGVGYTLETGLPEDSSESKRGLFLIQAFARKAHVERLNDMTVTTVTLDLENAKPSLMHRS